MTKMMMDLFSIRTIIGKIIDIEFLGNTRDGNPYYRIDIELSDGSKLRLETKKNALVNYSIGNYVGTDVEFDTDGKHIDNIRKPSNKDIAIKRRNDLLFALGINLDNSREVLIALKALDWADSH